MKKLLDLHQNNNKKNYNRVRFHGTQWWDKGGKRRLCPEGRPRISVAIREWFKTLTRKTAPDKPERRRRGSHWNTASSPRDGCHFQCDFLRGTDAICPESRRWSRAATPENSVFLNYLCLEPLSSGECNHPLSMAQRELRVGLDVSDESVYCPCVRGHSVDRTQSAPIGRITWDFRWSGASSEIWPAVSLALFLVPLTLHFTHSVLRLISFHFTKYCSCIHLYLTARNICAYIMFRMLHRVMLPSTRLFVR